MLTPTPGPLGPCSQRPWDLVLPTRASTCAKTHRVPAHQQADTTSKSRWAPQPAMLGTELTHQPTSTSCGTHLGHGPIHQQANTSPGAPGLAACYPETRFYPAPTTGLHIQPLCDLAPPINGLAPGRGFSWPCSQPCQDPDLHTSGWQPQHKTEQGPTFLQAHTQQSANHSRCTHTVHIEGTPSVYKSGDQRVVCC